MYFANNLVLDMRGRGFKVTPLLKIINDFLKNFQTFKLELAVDVISNYYEILGPTWSEANYLGKNTLI